MPSSLQKSSQVETVSSSLRQNKPTTAMQRNLKNQDFSRWKLKCFEMLERRHLGNIGLDLERPRKDADIYKARRVRRRDVIMMHYGKCSMPERQLQCIKTTSPYCIRKHFAGCMFFYLLWPIAHFSLLQILCHRLQQMCFGEIVSCILIVCTLPATFRGARAKTESWWWSTSQKTARETDR